MNFSAVILAGGKSSRMGQDKAWLEIGGQSLLARQIRLARTLGATEIFISGRPDQNFAPMGCPVLIDRFPEAGPLAGIERALNACSNLLLLVLAVDMPLVTEDLLRSIIAPSTKLGGVIPRVAGYIEPLAAIYPKTAAKLATDLLANRSIPGGFVAPGAKRFAENCVRDGLARFLELPDDCVGNFISWNEPKDTVVASAGI